MNAQMKNLFDKVEAAAMEQAMKFGHFSPGCYWADGSERTEIGIVRCQITARRNRISTHELRCPNVCWTLNGRRMRADELAKVWVK